MDERCTDGRGRGWEQSPPPLPPSHPGFDTGRTSPATTPGRTWAPTSVMPTARAEIPVGGAPLSTPDWTDQADHPQELTFLTSPRDPCARSRTTTGPVPAATTNKEMSWVRYGPKRVIKTAMKYIPWTNKTSGGERANGEKKGGEVGGVPMAGAQRSEARSKLDGRGRGKQEERKQQQKLPPQQGNQRRSAAEPAERPAAAAVAFTATVTGGGESDVAAVGGGARSPPSRHIAREEIASIDISESRGGGDIAVAGGGGGGGASHLRPGFSPSHRLSADYGGSGRNSGGSLGMAGYDRFPSSPDPAEDARMMELQAAFDRFDKDGDGYITQKELGDMLRSLGDEATDEDLAFMIQEVDKNGDGMIDREEFVLLNTVDARQRERELHAAFGIYDKDKNGVISVQELKSKLFPSIRLEKRVASRRRSSGFWSMWKVGSIDESSSSVVPARRHHASCST